MTAQTGSSAPPAPAGTVGEWIPEWRTSAGVVIGNEGRPEWVCDVPTLGPVYVWEGVGGKWGVSGMTRRFPTKEDAQAHVENEARAYLAARAPAAPTPGIKHDATKARWDLVPWESMIPVVSVLTSGAQKYAPDNWRKVPDARSRYFAAALRHMTAWWGGEINDPETNQPHLAHATCCLLFLIALEGK